MTANELKIPLYVKAILLIMGLSTLTVVLYVAQSIIVPIIFSILLAILLHPVVNFFVRIKINRVIAIMMTLLLTLLLIVAFSGLLFSQASRFSDSWPILVDKFSLTLNQAVNWASGYFDINPGKIDAWILKTKGELINTSGAAIGQTLINLGSGVVILFLIPLYIFLILFYSSFGVKNKLI